MGRSRNLADGTLAELNVDSNTLAVDATNNRVGIGTNSPSAPLHIQKTGADAGILIEETSITGYSQYLQLKDSTTSWYVVNRYASGGAGNSGFGIGTTTSGDYLQIDTSGRVTMPYQPMFTATAPSNQNMSATSNTILPLTNAFVNVGSHYNTSTKRFTAPVAGQYVFHLSGMVDSSITSTTNNSIISLYKNGSQLAYTHIYGPHPAGGSFTIILTAAANDYFEMYGQKIYLQYGNYITMFSGQLIG